MTNTLFGIITTANKGRAIRRIATNSNITNFADKEFSQQYRNFFYTEEGNHKIERQFEPTWTKANTDEVLFIPEFNDTIGFYNAIKDPMSVELFKPNAETALLRGIFSLNTEENSDKILFQLVDWQHTILKSKLWWMIHESGDTNTFVKVDSNGIRFNDKLVSVYENRKLYFTNFTMASRLFDLSTYLREANQETVISFLSHSSIETPKDVKEFSKRMSSTNKTLVSKVLAYGCLDRLSPEDICSRASNSKTNVEIKLSGNGKIIIPEAPDKLTRILMFLSNIILPSYLDDDCDYEAQETRRFKV